MGPPTRRYAPPLLPVAFYPSPKALLKLGDMNSPSTDLAARLELAVAAAREAGRLTLDFFRAGNYQVQRKADDSPVTEADRQAELYLREQIERAFPDDAIVGEEFGEKRGSTPYTWILDPIDGTKSFIHGVPFYGTLVGIMHEGQSRAGVIYMPALDEIAYAAIGSGAWYARGGESPRPARVSDCPRLAEGLFVTSQVDLFARRNAAGAFHRLEQAAWVTRTWGDCYGYLLVATGRAAAMVDPAMSVWDAAALLPVLQEAGGTFTDWSGNATVEAGEGVATNGRVLAEVLAVTAPFSRRR
jgi:histidinol-phosphatase